MLLYYLENIQIILENLYKLENIFALFLCVCVFKHKQIVKTSRTNKVFLV